MYLASLVYRGNEFVWLGRSRINPSYLFEKQLIIAFKRVYIMCITLC